MKLVTAAHNSAEVWGVLSADEQRLCPAAALGIEDTTLQGFIMRATPADWAALRTAAAGFSGGVALADVQLLAPIPEPWQEVLVMENNYCKDEAEAADFAVQLNGPEPPLPTYFYKKATLCNRDGGVIPSYPGHVETLDYQAELCAVVGRDAQDVDPDSAGDYILGYLVINNVIARNLTDKHRRPYIATSLDGFLPVGPYLVTADEFPADPVFCVRSYVNGEARQDATTALMRFSPRYAIADLSRYGVLKAGTLLSTGTPFGCGKDQIPVQYLKPGDTVTCAVDGVGSVTNTVV